MSSGHNDYPMISSPLIRCKAGIVRGNDDTSHSEGWATKDAMPCLFLLLKLALQHDVHHWYCAVPWQSLMCCLDWGWRNLPANPSGYCGFDVNKLNDSLKQLGTVDFNKRYSSRSEWCIYWRTFQRQVKSRLALWVFRAAGRCLCDWFKINCNASADEWACCSVQRCGSSVFVCFCFFYQWPPRKMTGWAVCLKHLKMIFRTKAEMKEEWVHGVGGCIKCLTPETNFNCIDSRQESTCCVTMNRICQES